MRPESFTSLKTFMDCPRLYRAKYVDKDLPFEQSPAAARGERIHAAVGGLVEKPKVPREPARIPDEPQAERNAERFISTLMPERLRARGWTVRTELELAIDGRFKRTGYHDRGAWLRGRLDLVMAPPPKRKGPVVVVDWKTGKTPGHELQLVIGAALLNPDHPGGKYMGVFAYLDGGTMTKIDIAGERWLRDTVKAAMAPLERAWTADEWPAKPRGPACRWCGMSARCAQERSGDLFKDFNQSKEA